MSIRQSLSGKLTAVVLSFIVAVSMSATLLPTVAYADDDQTKIEKDVQGFIDNANEAYAKEITKTLATQYPAVDVAPNDMKYHPEGGYAYGFRNAGSEAEHQAANFLVHEFEKLGLDVHKDAVNVDKWQYNGATFEMDGMTMEDPICSYASSGTDAAGITGEIVYLGDLESTSGAGTGYEWAYEMYYDEHGLVGDDRNMNGKIVVADIHQYADNWITPYYEEAYHQGAAALITYSYQYCNPDGTQTGTKWDHAVQIQDLCAENYKVPTVAISRCDGLKIKEQIKEAYAKNEIPTATLKVDNIVEPGGTSYNVVATLKGIADTGQRVVISGHYDKYWYGFNDDCAAIGNVFGVAKAMVDSNYKPLNDIVFIAHGAEEWGQMGTETDWATGSWGELHDVHTDWQRTTLAMINFELPAMTPDTLIGGEGLPADTIGSIFGCTEQVSPVLDSFADGKLLEQVNASTGKKVVEVADRYYHAQPMSDAYGWQFLGVPCYELRGYYGPGDDFSIYHTPFDDEDHYAPEAMDWCIKATAALAAQIDQSPAVEFSTEKISEKLLASISDDLSVYKKAGVDISTFKEAIADLQIAGDAYLTTAKGINTDYTRAVNDPETTPETLAAIIDSGVDLNGIGMDAFRICQDDILVILGDTDAVTRNDAIQQNYGLIEGALSFLKSKNPEEQAGALDLLWQINGGIEYLAYCFSEWNVGDAIKTLTCEKIPDGSNRACGHKVGYVETYPATYAIYHTFADGVPLASEGFKDEIAIYNNASKKLLRELSGAMSQELFAIEDMTGLYGCVCAIPAKVTGVKAKAKKGKKVKVTWNAAENGAIYQVAYKLKNAKKWSFKSTYTDKKTLTLKKLKKGKVYQIKVRACSADNAYGPWSNTVKVKVKK